MQMLYDSDNFVVVHNPPDETEEEAGKLLGFELVDKRDNTTLYITGDWAAAFHRQIQAWQENTPTQEQVEDVLDGYTQLATNPLIMH